MLPVQLSEAVGAATTAALHSPVMSGKVNRSATGAVTSSTMTFCVCVEVFPLPSVKDQVMV
jgi:hypothetical protein